MPPILRLESLRMLRGAKRSRWPINFSLPKNEGTPPAALNPLLPSSLEQLRLTSSWVHLTLHLLSLCSRRSESASWQCNSSSSSLRKQAKGHGQHVYVPLPGDGSARPGSGQLWEVWGGKLFFSTFTVVGTGWVWWPMLVISALRWQKDQEFNPSLGKIKPCLKKPKKIQADVCLLFFYFNLFLFSDTLYIVLSWNLLHRPGQPQTQTLLLVLIPHHAQTLPSVFFSNRFMGFNNYIYLSVCLCIYISTFTC